MRRPRGPGGRFLTKEELIERGLAPPPDGTISKIQSPTSST